MGHGGDGDGIQKKPLPKSKSPVQSGPSKDWKTPGERTGSGSGSVPTKEQLQNEYDWHSSQVTFKVDKVGLLVPCKVHELPNPKGVDEAR